ncbi:methyltransferase [Pyrus ussuriensis x Pyrus communis]|uniref:Methyltransferase n=1 Tax=Pyrus ussuriensis x Pyrus communis TaxID=2448454 RepID=A0A5N5GNH4_9ROSA|nr:methyltransferase [Pyrus ussuriensis x Pyrus communis]
MSLWWTILSQSLSTTLPLQNAREVVLCALLVTLATCLFKSLWIPALSWVVEVSLMQVVGVGYCGSGLFSRLFAKSGLFSLAVALDYSENMNIILVRADISRLPFATSSVDAVHAVFNQYFLWIIVVLKVAETSRVLRPGGVQVFTSESEFEDLCQACGLVGFTKVRYGLFVMISATKPT